MCIYYIFFGVNLNSTKAQDDSAGGGFFCVGRGTCLLDDWTNLKTNIMIFSDVTGRQALYQRTTRWWWGWWWCWLAGVLSSRIELGGHKITRRTLFSATPCLRKYFPLSFGHKVVPPSSSSVAVVARNWDEPGRMEMVSISITVLVWLAAHKSL